MVAQHEARIKEFMQKAGQEVPGSPIIPDLDTRILRAKLILEEAFETVEALGVDVFLDSSSHYINFDKLTFQESVINEPNLVEIVDGCCDVSVVTYGTLVACGVGAQPMIEEVDRHNLAKFGPGGYRREDGKWIKPPNLKPPRIAELIQEQKARI